MAWSTTVVAGIWLACLALFLEAVGFAIPFWASFVSKDTTAASSSTEYGTYVSVWYVMVCIKGESNSCKSKGIEPQFDSDNSFKDLKIEGNTQEIVVNIAAQVLGYTIQWNILQIVTTIGLGLILLAVLILICCRCAGIHSKGFFILSCLLLFFGGIISAGISVLAAIVIIVVHSFVEGDVTAETFPWSILLYGLGSLLSIVASIVFMVVTCKWRELGAYSESDKESYHEEAPMSNLSQSRGRDNPRYYDQPRKDHRNDRDRQPRDYNGSSQKYREGRHDYRDYNGSGYDRPNENNSYDRSYNQGGNSPYEKGSNYHPSRSGSDNMYRPYTASQRY